MDIPIPALLAILLNSAPDFGEYWAFTAGDVTGIELERQLQAGSYDVYNCDASKADGTVIFSLGAGAPQKLRFCVHENRKNKTGELVVKPGGYRLCLWRETGHCDDGRCYSVNVLDDCVDIDGRVR